MKDGILQAPKFIMVCTDAESKQLAGVNHLKDQDILVEHVPGPIHRRTNSQLLAFAHAGLMVRLKLNLAIYNVKYGPYNKCGNAGLFKELADHMSVNLKPNAAGLRMMWPAICRDRGWDFAKCNTERHRQEFLEKLPK